MATLLQFAATTLQFLVLHTMFEKAHPIMPKTPEEMLATLDAADRQHNIHHDILALEDLPKHFSMRRYVVRMIVSDMCRQAEVTVDDYADPDRFTSPSKQCLQHLRKLNDDHAPTLPNELDQLARQVGQVGQASIRQSIRALMYLPKQFSMRGYVVRLIVSDMCRQARVTVDEYADPDCFTPPSRQCLRLLNELNDRADDRLRYELYDLAERIGLIK